MNVRAGKVMPVRKATVNSVSSRHNLPVLVPVLCKTVAAWSATSQKAVSTVAHVRLTLTPHDIAAA